MTTNILIEKKFKLQIQDKLNSLNLEQIMFFSWLCGVRALPFLGKSDTFYHWSDNQKTECLNNILIALDVIATRAYNDIYGFEPLIINLHNNAFAAIDFNNICNGDTATYYTILTVEAAYKTSTVAHNNIRKAMYTKMSEAAKAVIYDSGDFSEISMKMDKERHKAINVFKEKISDPINYKIIAKLDTISDAATVTAFNAAAYLALAAERNKINLLNIILDDIKHIEKCTYSELNHNTNIYGLIWDNFQEILSKLNFEYWGNLYENIFKNSFILDREALDLRINAYSKIKPTDAKKVDLYLEQIEIEKRKCLINKKNLDEVTEVLNREYEYDIALSFAGEDRDYVEKVAEQLKNKGIQVFYDMYEKSELWGKDLYIHLDDIYQNKAMYCIIFISKFYKSKLWTNHEMRSAFTRAFSSNSEYILPARFDDTEIPGIRKTTGYLDLQALSPNEFAELTFKKVIDNLQSKKAYLISMNANRALEIELIFENQSFIVGKDKRYERGIFSSLYISQRHAVISLIKGSYYLTDLGATNGTSINYTKIRSGAYLIKDGDILSFADMEFIFHIKP